MIDCASSLLARVNFGGVMLFLGIFAVCRVLWNIQRSKQNVDLVDLILVDGRPNWKSCCGIGSFLIATWIIAHMELGGRLTETVFGLYLGTFVGGAVISEFRTRTADAGQDVRVQAPAGASVSVQSGPKEGA